MPRTKTFSIKMADLPNMVDAIFAGNHDDPGWVEMNANDKGRACVDALFPEAHIAWREPGNGAPADWHSFIITIPDVVAEMETALALAITRDADLDEANPTRWLFCSPWASCARAAAPPTSARVRSRSCSPIRDTKNEWPLLGAARRHRRGRDASGGDRKTAWTAISGRFAHPPRRYDLASCACGCSCPPNLLSPAPRGVTDLKESPAAPTIGGGTQTIISASTSVVRATWLSLRS